LAWWLQLLRVQYAFGLALPAVDTSFISALEIVWVGPLFAGVESVLCNTGVLHVFVCLHGGRVAPDGEGRTVLNGLKVGVQFVCSESGLRATIDQPFGRGACGSLLPTKLSRVCCAEWVVLRKKGIAG
jgi:hypothetical protein